jgi:outer membrane protein assembly factor BamC
VISASTVGDRTSASPAAGAATPSVALNSTEDTRIERQGNHRWIVTSRTPEQLWPILQRFWSDNGLSLSVDNAPAGIMETSWAENRAKLPQDIIRRTLGRLADKVYDTGTRDLFRTRLERTASGTEIYIMHRSAVEEFVGTSRDRTAWRAGPNDPQLEAEFLARLLVKIGQRDTATAVAAVANAPERKPTTPPVVSVPAAQAATATSLEVSDAADRAFRRVGLSLDRAGFTVEDRDRSAGIYFVRYVPGLAGAEEPGFLAKLFSSSKDSQTAIRYRVVVKGAGDGKSLVTVQTSQGQPETGEAAQRIISLIANDLR